MKITVKRCINIKDITNIIFCVFSVTYICEYLSIFGVMLSNIIFLLLGMISLLYGFCLYQEKTIKVSCYFIIYSGLFSLSYIYNHNADFIEILWPVAFFGIGTLFLEHGVSTRITGIVFKLYIFAMAFFSVIRGGVDNLGGSSSRNSISVGIVLFLSLHMIASYHEKRSIHFQYPLLAIAGCFLGVGRSGVLLSGLLLLLFVFISYDNGISKIRNIKLFVGVIVLVIGVIFVVNAFVPQLIGDAIYNFSWRGMDSRRTLIWSDYLSKTGEDFKNILFGANISGTYQLDFYHDNLHNSFFMLHAKFGLGGVIIVVFTLLKTGINILKDKNMYFFTPLCMLIFRMFFDYTNFNGILDIIMVVFLFYQKKEVDEFEEVLLDL